LKFSSARLCCPNLAIKEPVHTRKRRGRESANQFKPIPELVGKASARHHGLPERLFVENNPVRSLAWPVFVIIIVRRFAGHHFAPVERQDELDSKILFSAKGQRLGAGTLGHEVDRVGDVAAPICEESSDIPAVERYKQQTNKSAGNFSRAA